MGIFDRLLGKKARTSSDPVCVSCGKPVKASPRVIGGVKVYEGTECTGCGNIYCLILSQF